jgi:hypothetical protein
MLLVSGDFLFDAELFFVGADALSLSVPSISSVGKSSSMSASVSGSSPFVGCYEHLKADRRIWLLKDDRFGAAAFVVFGDDQVGRVGEREIEFGVRIRLLGSRRAGADLTNGGGVVGNKRPGMIVAFRRPTMIVAFRRPTLTGLAAPFCFEVRAILEARSVKPKGRILER